MIPFQKHPLLFRAAHQRWPGPRLGSVGHANTRCTKWLRHGATNVLHTALIQRWCNASAHLVIDQRRFPAASAEFEASQAAPINALWRTQCVHEKTQSTTSSNSWVASTGSLAFKTARCELTHAR